MTRKDLRLLADAIKLIPNSDLRAEVSMSIGHACLMSNPRFKWSIWNEACNVDLEESEV